VKGFAEVKKFIDAHKANPLFKNFEVKLVPGRMPVLIMGKLGAHEEIDIKSWTYDTLHAYLKNNLQQ
jgi:Na+/H+ antiporter NhaB